MSKLSVSIILPSLTPLEEIVAYKTFVNSDWHTKLDVQFVYLRNGLVPGDKTETARIEKLDTHELLYVPHWFFVSTAEENVYRLQDFMDLLKPRLFLIGNDDEIDWGTLVEALEHFTSNELDAMAWQWGFKQLRSDGSYSNLPIFAPTHLPGEAYDAMGALMMGEPMDSYKAFGALLSNSGPIYWLTYIGCQMFSREVFKQHMQYRPADLLCAHVFMQAQYFCSRDVRYGYFYKPVIERVGKEFLTKRQQGEFHGSMGNFRAWLGLTKLQNSVYLNGIVALEDDMLFNLMINGFGVSNFLVENSEEQAHGAYLMFVEMLSFCRDTCRQALGSPSHYFPNEAENRSLQDVHVAWRYLSRLQRMVKTYPAIYKPLNANAREMIGNSVELLKAWLHHLNPERQWMEWAHDCIGSILVELAFPIIQEMNNASFAAYMADRKKNVPALKEFQLKLDGKLMRKA